MLKPDFWRNKSNSQKVVKEKKFYEDLLKSYDESIVKLKDLNDLYELASEENNISIQKEVIKNIKELKKVVKQNEIKCFLSNEADRLIAMLKYMLELEELKVRIGLIC